MMIPSAIHVNLCVDNVSHASFSYNSGQNDITCTGGSGRIGNENEEGIQQVSPRIALYPSPAIEALTVLLEQEHTETVHLNIFSLNGHKVFSDRRIVGPDSRRLEVYVGHLDKGMHVINIQSGAVSRMLKFMKAGQLVTRDTINLFDGEAYGFSRFFISGHLGFGHD